jgi:hypothetical protein
MSITLQVDGYNPEGSRMNPHQAIIDKRPNECPVCHVIVMPEGTGQYWRAGLLLDCLYHCTADSCHRSFIAHYEQTNAGNPNHVPEFKLKSCSPITPVKANFDAEIKALSPSFVSIYEQASSAEGYRLEDIAGPGYRKALEFLIKDYAISTGPEFSTYWMRVSQAQENWPTQDSHQSSTIPISVLMYAQKASPNPVSPLFHSRRCTELTD